VKVVAVAIVVIIVAAASGRPDGRASERALASQRAWPTGPREPPLATAANGARDAAECAGLQARKCVKDQGDPQAGRAAQSVSRGGLDGAAQQGKRLAGSLAPR